MYIYNKKCFFFLFRTRLSARVIINNEKFNHTKRSLRWDSIKSDGGQFDDVQQSAGASSAAGRSV